MLQAVRQLFSAGKDREATEILVDHIMLVSPGAYRQTMLRGRKFDESGKLGDWNLSGCKISKLPPSFGALVCKTVDLSDNQLEFLPNSFAEIDVGRFLSLSCNKLEMLPDGFSETTIVGHLELGGNPHLYVNQHRYDVHWGGLVWESQRVEKDWTGLDLNGNALP